MLDAEWPTIDPALPLFVSGPNDRLQRICAALRFFLEFTLRWDEWLSLEQQKSGRLELTAVSDLRLAKALMAQIEG